MKQGLARVAIVGRPNVGKSTLFNLLTGLKLAMVHATPGVTRDARTYDASLGEKTFNLVDTAGFELSEGGLAGQLNTLAETAAQKSDVLILLLDGKDGVTPEDEALARLVRSMNKPVVVVVNKADVKEAETTAHEAYSLGFGEPVLISCTHSKGLDGLEDALSPHVEMREVEEDENAPVALAIVGRPNAGKSTLVNALLDEERMLTGPQAGLTRESVGALWEHDGQFIELIDTAGVRKRGRVHEELEKMSVGESLSAISRADAVVLVLDGTAPFEKQDVVLAERAVEEGKPLVIALNKWDLVDDKEDCLAEVAHRLEKGFSQVKDVPVVPISALNKKHLHKIMPEVVRLQGLWRSEISTSKLNRFLEGMLEATPPPMRKGRRLKIKYMTQTGTCPPTFSLWCNMPKEVPDSYVRYLTNGLREAFDLKGIVLRVYLKASDNPYHNK